MSIATVGTRYRVWCRQCGWTGVRTDNPDDCSCYGEWAVACRPDTPGPGCGRGVVYRCPKCESWRTIQAIAPVRHRPPTT